MRQRPSISRLTLGQRRFVLALVYAVVALPWIIRGALSSMGHSTNSPIDWVPPTFAARADYDDFCRRFGSGDVIVASWDGCVLSETRLDALTHALRTAKVFRDAQGRSCFETVVSGWEVYHQLTTAPLDLTPEQARERLRGLFVGADGETTCLVMTLTPDALPRRRFIVDKFAEAVTHFCQVPREQLHLAGPVVDGLAVDIASRSTLDHLAIPSAIVVFALCHLALRSLRAAALVFAISLYSQAVTLALIHYGGRDMTALLIVLPPLIQVLSVAGGIHLMNYYVDGQGRSDVSDPAAYALSAGWLPCVLSAATTAVGLASLTVSKLSPIRDFGIFASCGVLLTTALVLVMVPGTLSLWQWQPAVRSGNSRVRRPWMTWDLFGQWIVRRHYAILSGSVLIMLVGAVGIVSLRASVRIETLFASNSVILQDYAWFERRLGPLIPVEVVVHCDETCALTLKQRLQLVHRIEERLTAVEAERLGGGSAAADFGATPTAKRARRGFGAQHALLSALTFLPDFPVPPYAQVEDPRVREQLAQRFDDQTESQVGALLPQLVRANVVRTDGKSQDWRVTTYISSLDKIDYGDYLRRIKAAVTAALDSEHAPSLDGVTLAYTGAMPLVHEIQGQLLTDLFQSFLSALVVITLTMVLLQGGVAAGLIAMVSNVFPILLLFGGMAWLRRDLDIGSVMTASIALGIAVDDTLHYLSFFRRALDDGKSRRDAVQFAFEHCGRAMIQSTVVLTLGVAVFALSDFLPTCRFAWMMAASLTLALAGDLIILPALLISPLGGFFVEYPVTRVGDEPIAIPITTPTVSLRSTSSRVPRRASLDQSAFDDQSGAEAQDDARQRRLRFPQPLQDEEYGR